MNENNFIETVVAGAGLTGLTTAYNLKRSGKPVLVIEKSGRTGGQIQTLNRDGFVFETGPNTGTVSHPEVAELFSALSPACELETADENANNRWIWKGNRFYPLPSGLFGGIATPLFSWPDKFRILGEPFRAKGTNPDESVGELASRRLGKTFVDYAVDPFISGIYAGDPYSLVTRYALPKLYNLEQNYGSFIKGSIAKAKEPKTERDRLATKKVFSVKGGLGNLASALADAIGRENIVLSASSLKITPDGENWKIDYRLADGERSIRAKNVVTTVGSHALPEMLPFVEKTDMDKISCLRYAPVIQVVVGVKDILGLRFNAFGGLIPSCEKKPLLGVLFPSACFAGRAPENGMLFSFFIGGMKAIHLTELSDSELTALVLREFHDMLKFSAGKEPDMIHIARHKYAIPQYEKSTGERLETVEKLQNRYSGLVIGGNLKNGISMGDRILQGTNIAKSLVNQ
ncbi:MAG: protoporphyrinogen oxidase [Dysgonamonadaceae bacterium]|nr:protoporphyrinogen oxidase [Dysgonamonadaceae bacterium]